MSEERAHVESFTRAEGFGHVVFGDGTRLRFDIGACTFVPEPGAEVRAWRATIPNGTQRVVRVSAVPAIEDPESIQTQDDVDFVLDQLTARIAQEGRTEPIRGGLVRMRAYAQRDPYSRIDRRAVVARIDALLAEWGSGIAAVVPGHPLADAMIAEVTQLSADRRAAWDALIDYAATASGSKPSSKWLKAGRKLVDAIGADVVLDAFARWFPYVTKPTEMRQLGWWQVEPPVEEGIADRLKGLVWIASTLDDPREAMRPDPSGARSGEARTLGQLPRGEGGSAWPRDIAAIVGDLASVCFKKIPGYGQVCASVGNACVFTLGALTGVHGVAQLGRLKSKVRYAVPLRLIDKALGEAAARRGVSPDELEEMSVPSFGIGPEGFADEELGDWVARIAIVDGGATLEFRRGEEARSSAPAELKKDHAEDLKELKARVKEIDALLPAQSARIEGLWLSRRKLRAAEWRERYIEHGLVGLFARRLIWTFVSGTNARAGIIRDGRVVDVGGAEITVAEGDEVELWHPLGRPAADVLAWRRALEAAEITQPFKQAHREIYVLTDAEIATDTYSNRFAAHVLRQHQFAALCRERGWRYTLQGQWDSANTPHRKLERWDLEVELWVEAAFAAEETSDAGIFLHVTTDQVRFCRERVPLQLTTIPAIVFSELMRDVDLFVAVCSVGNDPTWFDRGHPGGRDYWHGYAFGALGASAQTRREALARIVPKLKIARQCSIDGKFLVVQGKLGTYKIHLGSGNILMEPNDQYLCIVPDRDRKATTGAIRLPFEGDAMLSVVLSKALLLANDDKIKDRSILSQIERR